MALNIEKVEHLCSVTISSKLTLDCFTHFLVNLVNCGSYLRWNKQIELHTLELRMPINLGWKISGWTGDEQYEYNPLVNKFIKLLLLYFLKSMC